MLTNKEGFFMKLTDKERKQAEADFQKDYNRVKDITAEVITIKIKKDRYSKNYYGMEVKNNKETGYRVPLKRMQNVDLKQGQLYKVYVNDYMKIIKWERIK